MDEVVYYLVRLKAKALAKTDKWLTIPEVKGLCEVFNKRSGGKAFRELKEKLPSARLTGEEDFEYRVSSTIREALAQ
jgi:hypothetical protein